MAINVSTAYYNKYLNNYDLINQFNIKNIHVIPSLKWIKIFLFTEKLYKDEELELTTSDKDYVIISSMLMFYLVDGYLPYAHGVLKSFAPGEKNYLYKKNIEEEETEEQKRKRMTYYAMKIRIQGESRVVSFLRLLHFFNLKPKFNSLKYYLKEGELVEFNFSKLKNFKAKTNCGLRFSYIQSYTVDKSELKRLRKFFRFSFDDAKYVEKLSFNFSFYFKDLIYGIQPDMLVRCLPEFWRFRNYDVVSN